MNPSKIGGLLLVVALAACRDRAPQGPKLSDALPNLPLPPEASFVSRAGGPDALQLTMRSPMGADSVAAYYRGVFTRGGWHLLNDAKDSEGATVLFAQQEGPPLWVRIQAAENGRGTLVELSGAVMPKADSARTKPAT